MRDKTGGRQWFTRLDLKNGFYRIRVAAAHEWKIEFRTKKGPFAYIVIPFELTNAPATCREMTDTIFEAKAGCVRYMNDILIYGGTTEAEHQVVVPKDPQQCVKHGLAVNLTKSEFHVRKTISLGHIVNGSQGRMDPAKLETMYKWPVRTHKKEVLAFLGFSNYYRGFTENYRATARPLIELTKDVPCSCGHQQQQAFDELRTRFLSTSILTHFDSILVTIKETDTRHQAIAGILSQYHIVT